MVSFYIKFHYKQIINCQSCRNAIVENGSYKQKSKVAIARNNNLFVKYISNKEKNNKLYRIKCIEYLK